MPWKEKKKEKASSESEAEGKGRAKNSENDQKSLAKAYPLSFNAPTGGTSNHTTHNFAISTRSAYPCIGISQNAYTSEIERLSQKKKKMI